ncbi:CHAT domain-containing protein [Ephemerocybe angulata]|uniref:CHAT domain-containing protein n=1 Tax=Ephemerocybe angulata TaxID=980116 RepID=A0A8H6HWU8_9AGAR|nr:CHAT domain-containing protein [Tulosesus angulatus]
MEQQSGSLVSNNRLERNHFLITDINLERTGDGIEVCGTSLSLTDLWIFGIPGSGDGKFFMLVNASPGRWEVDGFIGITAETDAIDCVVKCDEEDVGFIHLDAEEMRSTVMHPEHRLEKKMEMCDDGMQLTMSWKVAEIPSEVNQVPDDVAEQLNNRAILLLCTFEQTGDLLYLTEGISMLQQAVDLTTDGHFDMPGRLTNLGGAFKLRFDRTGDPTDIADAISAQQRAVDLASRGHPDLPSCLGNLGISLLTRFEYTGELTDIDNSISLQQRAASLIPHGHFKLPNFLNSLGNSLTRRFERTGNVTDIAGAISAHQKSVELTPHDDAKLPIRLSNLGTSLTSRFERTAELTDIADAILVLQRAVNVTPHGHPDLPLRLLNLGNSFNLRFERTGELTDIADAVSAHQRAVDLIPHGHVNRPTYLNNLGSSFMRRFTSTGDASDLADAISARRKAVNVTPLGHTDLPGILNNLGASLTCCFEQTGKLSHITEAISVQQKALSLTPQDHINLPSLLVNLGDSFSCRFDQTGKLTEIDEAIALHQRAAGLIPQGHACLPTYLNRLGHSFNSRFLSGGNSGDLEQSLACYRAAATSDVGPPREKLRGAKCWASMLVQHCPQSPEILPSFDAALGLVALIAGLEQTVRGRYNQLESTSGLALKAAAAACVLDRPDKALEWLEQGRCLVWSQLNNLRTPLDDLRIHDKDLAQAIANVSKQLEAAGSSRGQANASTPLSDKISLEDEARAHLALARKWDDLLKIARAIPGFETFLMPPSCSALMQQLPESPIVVINMDNRRCDALALMDGLDEPLHIPLPSFSVEKAREYRTVLRSQLSRHHLRAREANIETSIDSESWVRGVRPAPVRTHVEGSPVHQVLRGLWEEVVKPILDALGFSSVAGTSGIPPRLWWCPTGPLSFLPLHAAGMYRGSDADTVFNHVVSSYTPTVTALTDRVKNRRLVDAQASGLLLTSQPRVSGSSPIPGTTTEVRSIFKQAEESGVRVLKLEGDEMTITGCLERMQDFSSIHLACHGSQNAAEPLQSRFLFHQGSLELGKIIQSNLQNADLAFLSACQTSTGEEKLSDEAVHLAAGMLAAGYRRVVGTMWSIGDRAGQEVATNFYKHLFTQREGTSGAVFDGTLSAIALHYATQELRLGLDNSEHSLLSWIPFVHFGY